MTKLQTLRNWNNTTWAKFVNVVRYGFLCMRTIRQRQRSRYELLNCLLCYRGNINITVIKGKIRNISIRCVWVKTMRSFKSLLVICASLAVSWRQNGLLAHSIKSLDGFCAVHRNITQTFNAFLENASRFVTTSKRTHNFALRVRDTETRNKSAVRSCVRNVNAWADNRSSSTDHICHLPLIDTCVLHGLKIDTNKGVQA